MLSPEKLAILSLIIPAATTILSRPETTDNEVELVLSDIKKLFAIDKEFHDELMKYITLALDTRTKALELSSKEAIDVIAKAMRKD